MRNLEDKEKGVALVATLVLLVVALLLGLSSYQSAKIDESMAGNQHAAGQAFMAAEYGASYFWDTGMVLLPNDGTWDENSTSILRFPNLYDLEYYDWTPVGSSSNAFFKIEEVHPRRPNGIDYEVVVLGSFAASEAVSGDGTLRRVSVVVEPDGMGFRNLSPLNFISEITSLNGINSQAELEGELVEGRRNPAVSAGSYEDALKIVNEILGNNSSGKYTFVPDSPGSSDGVFYAAPTVSTDDSGGVFYTGDYSSCNGGNNRLCNYKGGVSTKPAEEIFNPEDAGPFHTFISTVFSAYTASDEYNFSTQLSGGHAGVSIVSGEEFGNSNYSPERNCDENNVCAYPERISYDGGSDFYGDGFLIIDGDVEFNGDPNFDGLIVVLGDYTVKGGGGDDLNGAIIAAPYSCDAAGVCGFDPIDVDARGGGNNDYLHSLEALDAAFVELRKLSPEAARNWFFTNNGGAGEFTFSPVSISEKIL